MLSLLQISSLKYPLQVYSLSQIFYDIPKLKVSQKFVHTLELTQPLRKSYNLLQVYRYSPLNLSENAEEITKKK